MDNDFFYKTDVLRSRIKSLAPLDFQNLSFLKKEAEQLLQSIEEKTDLAGELNSICFSPLSRDENKGSRLQSWHRGMDNLSAFIDRMDSEAQLLDYLEKRTQPEQKRNYDEILIFSNASSRETDKALSAVFESGLKPVIHTLDSENFEKTVRQSSALSALLFHPLKDTTPKTACLPLFTPPGFFAVMAYRLGFLKGLLGNNNVLALLITDGTVTVPGWLLETGVEILNENSNWTDHIWEWSAKLSGRKILLS